MTVNATICYELAEGTKTGKTRCENILVSISTSKRKQKKSFVFHKLIYILKRLTIRHNLEKKKNIQLAVRAARETSRFKFIKNIFGFQAISTWQSCHSSNCDGTKTDSSTSLLLSFLPIIRNQFSITARSASSQNNRTNKQKQCHFGTLCMDANKWINFYNPTRFASFNEMSPGQTFTWIFGHALALNHRQWIPFLLLTITYTAHFDKHWRYNCENNHSCEENH